MESTARVIDNGKEMGIDKDEGLIDDEEEQESTTTRRRLEAGNYEEAQTTSCSMAELGRTQRGTVTTSNN